MTLAARKANDFDRRADTQEYEALLLGKVVEKRIDFETADTRPLSEIMRDDWLAHRVFDPIRSTDKFREIIAKL